MKEATLKKRVTELEREVAQLKSKLVGGGKPNPWLDQLFGVFADDPAFKEATALGRKFRRAADQKALKGKSVPHGHS